MRKFINILFTLLFITSCSNNNNSIEIEFGNNEVSYTIDFDGKSARGFLKSIEKDGLSGDYYNEDYDEILDENYYINIDGYYLFEYDNLNFVLKETIKYDELNMVFDETIEYKSYKKTSKINDVDIAKSFYNKIILNENTIYDLVDSIGLPSKFSYFTYSNPVITYLYSDFVYSFTLEKQNDNLIIVKKNFEVYDVIYEETLSI